MRLALRAVLAPAAAAAALLLAAAPLAAQDPVRQPVGNSSPTLTPAIKVGNMVYASGQLGLSREPGDTSIESQTRRALENTKAVLEQAGTRMDHVVRCTVFLVEASHFQRMNAVYREFFPNSPPARSTVVVKALVVPQANVEIECTAVMPAM
jgi:2-iminobutanoate/2-iminopropanoate deaminase